MAHTRLGSLSVCVVALCVFACWAPLYSKCTPYLKALVCLFAASCIGVGAPFPKHTSSFISCVSGSFRFRSTVCLLLFSFFLLELLFGFSLPFVSPFFSHPPHQVLSSVPGRLRRGGGAGHDLRKSCSNRYAPARRYCCFKGQGTHASLARPSGPPLCGGLEACPRATLAFYF